MVAQTHAVGQAFLDSLLAQRDRYRDEKTRLTTELRRVQGDLAKTEAAAKAVEDLLRIEAPELTKDAAPATAGLVAIQYFDPDRPFLRAAYEILQEVGSPVYYRELADRIRASGVVIPGKDPASNLYAHLRRHPRFARPTPGHFGLRDVGEKADGSEATPAAKPRRRRKRRTRAGSSRGAKS